MRKILEAMTLDQYKELVDSKFHRQKINPPSRVSETYFNPDGTAKPILEEIAAHITRIWPEIARKGEKIIGVYVVGPHAGGTFKDNSDIDIVVYYEGSFEDRGYLARNLRQKFTSESRFACTGTDVPKHEKEGRIDFGLFDIKPFGALFDILNREWVTYDKREIDYIRFQWAVYHMNVD